MTYPNGKRNRLYYYSRDRTACVTWLSEKRLQKARGTIGSGDDITFIDWLQVWLDCYTPRIRDSTRMNYKGYLENYISTSKMASMPLAKISTDTLQQFIISCEKSGQPDRKGLSAKSVRNLFSMLHAAMKQAIGNGLLLQNPCDFVQLPRVKQPEIQPLTDEEVAKLLNVCRGERYGIAVMLLFFGGFRLGELLALRHSSLREEEDVWYVRVEQSLNRVTNFDAKPGETKTVLRLGEPKSKQSKRDVPLLPQVLEALQDHMTRQKNEATSSFGLYDSDPFLIANELGNVIDPTTFRTWFNRMVEKAGITRHIRVHDTRHTSATLMLRAGATPHEVALILGHSSSQVTEKFYLHSDLKNRANAMQKLADIADKLTI